MNWWIVLLVVPAYIYLLVKLVRAVRKGKPEQYNIFGRNRW